MGNNHNVDYLQNKYFKFSQVDRPSKRMLWQVQEVNICSFAIVRSLCKWEDGVEPDKEGKVMTNLN
jgi:hypothetical protein